VRTASLLASLLLLAACSSWEEPLEPGYQWQREYFDAETDLWTQVPIPPGEPGSLQPAPGAAPATPATPPPPRPVTSYPRTVSPPTPLTRPGVPPPPPPPSWPR
jgi:hypothetical protein